MFIEVWNFSPKYSLDLLCIEIFRHEDKTYHRFWCQDEKQRTQSPYFSFLPKDEKEKHNTLIDLLDLLLETKEETIAFQFSFKAIQGKPNAVLSRATLREGSRNMLLLLNTLSKIIMNDPTNKYKSLQTKLFLLEAIPVYVNNTSIPIPDDPMNPKKQISIPLLDTIQNQKNEPRVFINFFSVKHPISDRFFTKVQISTEKRNPQSLIQDPPLPLYPCVPPFTHDKMKSAISYVKFLHSQKRSESHHHPGSVTPFFDPKDLKDDLNWIENNVLRKCSVCESSLMVMNYHELK